ncbi:MAG: hypothetical protein ABII82_06940 [Verrucomicrobiota bacterium]
MNSKLSIGLGLLVAAFSVSVASADAFLLQDDFTSIDTTSVWTNSKTPGANTVSVPFGTTDARFTVGSPNSSQRTFLTTQATNINPFDGVLTVNLNGLSADAGVAAPTGNGNRTFFAMVGMANNDTVANFYATTGTSTLNENGALALLVKLGSSGSYTMEVIDYGASTVSVSFGLTSIPTDISFEIDGAAKTWSATLTGSTFVGGGATQAGTFSNYTEGSVSRLSIGAVNLGGASGDYSSSGTTYYLDGISISQAAIPEPSATVALMGLGALVPLMGRHFSRRSVAERK